jgi:hypothetical protein
MSSLLPLLLTVLSLLDKKADGERNVLIFDLGGGQGYHR